MRRLVSVLAAIALSIVAFGQSAEEIVQRMEKAMEGHEAEGTVVGMDMKIPIIGTVTTKTWIVGDRTRTEGGAAGVKFISWQDENTIWTLTEKDGKPSIEIDNKKPGTKGDNEADMLKGVADGYDLTISKETADEWYILCKKSKTNKDKDDPKTMDLVVSKADYICKSLTAKVSGVTLKLYDFAFGVDEKLVTFNPEDYPGVEIVDKRK